MEGECEDPWNGKGTYGLTYSMFSLTVAVIFFGATVMSIWEITLYLTVVLLVFVISEYRLRYSIISTLTDKTYESSKMISVFLIMSNLAVSASAILVFYGRFLNFDRHSLTFTDTYEASLFISVMILPVFSCFKMLLFTFNVINVFYIKRGLFALLHRVIIIIRSLVVTPLWIRFFTGSHEATFVSEVFGRDDMTISRLYIIAKCLYFSQLCWDFDGVRREFLSIWTKARVSDDEDYNCEVCHGIAKDPVKLRCNHVYCFKCVSQVVAKSPFCPVCDKQAFKNPKFSFFDGHVSFSAIFCCF